MKIDVEILLILIRAVRILGPRKVNKVMQKYFKKKERNTGRDYSFEKQEIGRIVFEL
jgi:hypothetical protein